MHTSTGRPFRNAIQKDKWEQQMVAGSARLWLMHTRFRNIIPKDKRGQQTVASSTLVVTDAHICGIVVADAHIYRKTIQNDNSKRQVRATNNCKLNTCCDGCTHLGKDYSERQFRKASGSNRWLETQHYLSFVHTLPERQFRKHNSERQVGTSSSCKLHTWCDWCTAKLFRETTQKARASSISCQHGGAEAMGDWPSS